MTTGYANKLSEIGAAMLILEPIGIFMISQRKQAMVYFLRNQDGCTGEEKIVQYVETLLDIIQNMQNNKIWSTKDVANFLSAVDRNDFNAFLSGVCELNILHHFKTHFPSHFEAHVDNHTNGKNFDFSFKNNGIKFNVEIKTYSSNTPTSFNSGDSKAIKFFLPKNEIKMIHEKSGFWYSRNLMNPTRNFIHKADEQLVKPTNGAGVIFLCCRTLDEYADVLECLAGVNGGLRFSHSGIMHINKNQPKGMIISELDKLKNITAFVVSDLAWRHLIHLNDKLLNSSYKNHDGSLEMEDINEAWQYKGTMPTGLLLNDFCHEPDLFHKPFHSHYAHIFDELCAPNVGIQEAVFSMFGKAYKLPANPDGKI